MKHFFKEQMSKNSITILSAQLTRVIQLICSFFRTVWVKSRCLAALVVIIISILGTSACRRENPEAKYKRLMESAQQYQKNKQYKEARIQIQSAIDAQPHSAEAYYQLAEVLLRLQMVPQAVENYNTALNYNPNHREARLHLAAILLASHQWELAESQVEKLLEANPQDNEALILKANYNAAGPHKNFEKTREILEAVLKRVPNNASALASMGNLEMSEGNNKKAEQFLTKAVAADPESMPLQMALADLYAREGKLDEAQATLEKLLQKNPQEATLHFVFGEFLLNRSLPDKAFEEFSAVLKIDPRHHDARDRLYDLYVVKGNKAEAKKLTAELAKQFPDDPGLNYFRGRDLELDGKLAESLKYFMESVKLVNTFAPGFRRAGIIELKLGKENEGIEHLNQSVAIDPSEASSRMVLAERLFWRREFSQAAEHLNQILMRYPRHLPANILRADIAMVEGQMDKARVVYDYLIREFPKDPAGYFKMGLLEEKSKNFDEAIKWYSKTLEFDRGVLLPAERIMDILRGYKKMELQDIIKFISDMRAKSTKSIGEYDLLLATLNLQAAKNREGLEKARALYEKALEEKPDLIGAYYGIAQIDALNGDLEASIQSYEKLLSKNPKHLPSHMMLALSRERQGKYEEAAAAYRKVLEISPTFAPAANNLAWLLAENLNGDLDEALRLAETAKEQLPKEASVTDTLAWVHFRRGSARVALPIIEEALDLEKLAGEDRQPNPEILYHAAAIKAEAGRTEEAKETIIQALKIVDKNNPVRAKLEELQKKLSLEE